MPTEPYQERAKIHRIIRQMVSQYGPEVTLEALRQRYGPKTAQEILDAYNVSNAEIILENLAAKKWGSKSPLHGLWHGISTGLEKMGAGILNYIPGVKDMPHVIWGTEKLTHPSTDEPLEGTLTDIVGKVGSAVPEAILTFTPTPLGKVGAVSKAGWFVTRKVPAIRNLLGITAPIASRGIDLVEHLAKPLPRRMGEWAKLYAKQYPHHAARTFDVVVPNLMLIEAAKAGTEGGTVPQRLLRGAARGAKHAAFMAAIPPVSPHVTPRISDLSFIQRLPRRLYKPVTKTIGGLATGSEMAALGALLAPPGERLREAAAQFPIGFGLGVIGGHPSERLRENINALNDERNLLSAYINLIERGGASIGRDDLRKMAIARRRMAYLDRLLGQRPASTQTPPPSPPPPPGSSGSSGPSGPSGPSVPPDSGGPFNLSADQLSTLLGSSAFGSSDIPISPGGQRDLPALPPARIPSIPLHGHRLFAPLLGRGIPTPSSRRNLLALPPGRDLPAPPEPPAIQEQPIIGDERLRPVTTEGAPSEPIMIEGTPSAPPATEQPLAGTETSPPVQPVTEQPLAGAESPVPPPKGRKKKSAEATEGVQMPPQPDATAAQEPTPETPARRPTVIANINPFTGKILGVQTTNWEEWGLAELKDVVQVMGGVPSTTNVYKMLKKLASDGYLLVRHIGDDVWAFLEGGNNKEGNNEVILVARKPAPRVGNERMFVVQKTTFDNMMNAKAELLKKLQGGQSQGTEVAPSVRAETVQQDRRYRMRVGKEITLTVVLTRQGLNLYVHRGDGVLNDTTRIWSGQESIVKESGEKITENDINEALTKLVERFIKDARGSQSNHVIDVLGRLTQGRKAFSNMKAWFNAQSNATDAAKKKEAGEAPADTELTPVSLGEPAALQEPSPITPADQPPKTNSGVAQEGRTETAQEKIGKRPSAGANQSPLTINQGEDHSTWKISRAGNLLGPFSTVKILRSGNDLTIEMTEGDVTLQNTAKNVGDLNNVIRKLAGQFVAQNPNSVFEFFTRRGVNPFAMLNSANFRHSLKLDPNAGPSLNRVTEVLTGQNVSGRMSLVDAYDTLFGRGASMGRTAEEMVKHVSVLRQIAESLTPNDYANLLADQVIHEIEWLNSQNIKKTEKQKRTQQAISKAALRLERVAGKDAAKVFADRMKDYRKRAATAEGKDVELDEIGAVLKRVAEMAQKEGVEDAIADALGNLGIDAKAMEKMLRSALLEPAPSEPTPSEPTPPEPTPPEPTQPEPTQPEPTQPQSQPETPKEERSAPTDDVDRFVRGVTLDEANRAVDEFGTSFYGLLQNVRRWLNELVAVVGDGEVALNRKKVELKLPLKITINTLNELYNSFTTIQSAVSQFMKDAQHFLSSDGVDYGTRTTSYAIAADLARRSLLKAYFKAMEKGGKIDKIVIPGDETSPSSVIFVNRSTLSDAVQFLVEIAKSEYARQVASEKGSINVATAKQLFDEIQKMVKTRNVSDKTIADVVKKIVEMRMLREIPSMRGGVDVVGTVGDWRESLRDVWAHRRDVLNSLKKMFVSIYDRLIENFNHETAEKFHSIPIISSSTTRLFMRMLNNLLGKISHPTSETISMLLAGVHPNAITNLTGVNIANISTYGRIAAMLREETRDVLRLINSLRAQGYNVGGRVVVLPQLYDADIKPSVQNSTFYRQARNDLDGLVTEFFDAGPYIKLRRGTQALHSDDIRNIISLAVKNNIGIHEAAWEWVQSVGINDAVPYGVFQHNKYIEFGDAMREANLVRKYFETDAYKVLEAFVADATHKLMTIRNLGKNMSEFETIFGDELTTANKDQQELLKMAAKIFHERVNVLEQPFMGWLRGWMSWSATSMLSARTSILNLVEISKLGLHWLMHPRTRRESMGMFLWLGKAISDPQIKQLFLDALAATSDGLSLLRFSDIAEITPQNRLKVNLFSLSSLMNLLTLADRFSRLIAATNGVYLARRLAERVSSLPQGQSDPVAEGILRELGIDPHNAADLQTVLGNDAAAHKKLIEAGIRLQTKLLHLYHPIMMPELLVRGMRTRGWLGALTLSTLQLRKFSVMTWRYLYDELNSASRTGDGSRALSAALLGIYYFILLPLFAPVIARWIKFFEQSNKKDDEIARRSIMQLIGSGDIPGLTDHVLDSITMLTSLGLGPDLVVQALRTPGSSGMERSLGLFGPVGSTSHAYLSSGWQSLQEATPLPAARAALLYNPFRTYTRPFVEVFAPTRKEVHDYSMDVFYEPKVFKSWSPPHFPPVVRNFVIWREKYARNKMWKQIETSANEITSPATSLEEKLKARERIERLMGQFKQSLLTQGIVEASR